MGKIVRMDQKPPAKCWDVSWPFPLSKTLSAKSCFLKIAGLNPPLPHVMCPVRAKGRITCGKPPA